MKSTNRKALNSDHIAKIVSDWEYKKPKDFAEEFGVSVATIRNAVYKIRKLYPDRCPKISNKLDDKTIHIGIRKADCKEESSTTAMTVIEVK